MSNSNDIGGQEQGQVSAGTIQIPLKWDSVRDVPTVYANQLYVTHAGGEFYLVFGEVVLPAPDATASAIDHLDVKPLVKIAVPRHIMGDFIEAMNTNYDNFLQRMRKVQESQVQDEQ